MPFFLVPSTVSNRGQMDSSAQLQEAADEVCQIYPNVGQRLMLMLLLRHWGHFMTLRWIVSIKRTQFVYNVSHIFPYNHADTCIIIIHLIICKYMLPMEQNDQVSPR